MSWIMQYCLTANWKLKYFSYNPQIHPPLFHQKSTINFSLGWLIYWLSFFPFKAIDIPLSTAVTWLLCDQPILLVPTRSTGCIVTHLTVNLLPVLEQWWLLHAGPPVRATLSLKFTPWERWTDSQSTVVTLFL